MMSLLRCLKDKGWNNNRRVFFYVIFQDTLQVMSNLLSIYFTKKLIDNICPDIPLFSVIICFGGIVVSLILDHIITKVIMYMISYQENIIKKEMDIRIDLHTTRMPYEYLESLEGQEDIEKARVGLGLAGGIFENIHLLVESIIKLISMAILIVYIGDVSVLFVVVIVIFNIIKNYIRKKEVMNDKKLEVKQVLINRQYRYYFNEMFSFEAGKVIRIYNADKFIAREADIVLKRVFENMQDICNITIINNMIIQIMNILSLSVVMIYGYTWIRTNGASVGKYSLFILSYSKIIDYCVKSIDNINQFYENAKAYKVYDNYIGKEKEKNIGIKINQIDKIEFRNVTFTYPYGSRETLKNVSFEIKSIISSKRLEIPLKQR